MIKYQLLHSTSSWLNFHQGFNGRSSLELMTRKCSKELWSYWKSHGYMLRLKSENMLFLFYKNKILTYWLILKCCDWVEIFIQVAIFLIQRNRHALIGRAIDAHDMEKVLNLLKNDPVLFSALNNFSPISLCYVYLPQIDSNNSISSIFCFFVLVGCWCSIWL